MKQMRKAWSFPEYESKRQMDLFDSAEINIEKFRTMNQENQIVVKVRLSDKD